jgi:hypothetical protein
MVTGYVYFVACKDPNYRIANPHMKIGCTTRLDGRLRAIQTGSPVALMFMGYIESDDPGKLERYFHDLFKKDRKHGEWFDVTKAMITRINCYPVIDNHFEDFFLRSEEIASKEIKTLRDEIALLKAIIAKKDNVINESANPIPISMISKRSKKKNFEKFKHECLYKE